MIYIDDYVIILFLRGDLMIPKKIHYCWFGQNEMPLQLKKYVDNWKIILHDYEIIRWDENNFDINSADFTSEAYEHNMWAFVSDYVRLKALYEEGGIYLDTDVELLKKFDHLLDNKAFVGFESRYNLGSAVVASESGNLWIKSLLDEYYQKHFINDDLSLDKTPNTKYFTDVTTSKFNLKLNNKKQSLNCLTVYPRDYFYPENLYTHTMNITDNSICIHHWNGSWCDKKEPSMKDKIRTTLYSVVGETVTEEFYKNYWRVLKKIKK